MLVHYRVRGTVPLPKGGPFNVRCGESRLGPSPRPRAKPAHGPAQPNRCPPPAKERGSGWRRGGWARDSAGSPRPPSPVLRGQGLALRYGTLQANLQLSAVPEIWESASSVACRVGSRQRAAPHAWALLAQECRWRLG